MNGERLEPDSRNFEIQEILSIPPSGLIRWGITVMCGIVLIGLTICHFIKYPEIIHSRLRITSDNPPISIVARSTGHLTFFIQDKTPVKQGTYLALIDNSADSSDVLDLIKFSNSFSAKGSNSFTVGDLRVPKNLNVGELQTTYLSLVDAIERFQSFTALDLHGSQIRALTEQINEIQILENALKQQTSIAKEDFDIARRKFTIDSSLYAQEVMSTVEFDQSRSHFLAVKRNLVNAYQSMASNTLKVLELDARIRDLTIKNEESIVQLKNSISNSFRNLESGISDWKQRYLLVSPVDGTVVFFEQNSNRFIASGEEVLRVMPQFSSRFFCEVLIPTHGAGKVEVGQRVNIKLDNYPHQEYGIIVGTIQSISNLPKKNLYSVKIELPNQLTTSYQKTLSPSHEMGGDADIITKDLRLTERITFQFKTLLDKTTIKNKTSN